MPAWLSRAHGGKALCGRRRFRLQQAGQAGVNRGDGDVHAEAVPGGQRRQQVKIAQNQRALGGDGKIQPLEFAEHPEHAARDLELLFRRLVRVGGRAERDGQAAVAGPAEFGAEQRRRAQLGENLALKFAAVVQLHELVGVARVTILAAEFAAAIGIERPGKGQAAARFTVERRARGQRKVFHARTLAHPGTGLRQARNAYQFAMRRRNVAGRRAWARGRCPSFAGFGCRRVVALAGRRSAGLGRRRLEGDFRGGRKVLHGPNSLNKAGTIFAFSSPIVKSLNCYFKEFRLPRNSLLVSIT